MTITYNLELCHSWVAFYIYVGTYAHARIEASILILSEPLTRIRNAISLYIRDF